MLFSSFSPIGIAQIAVGLTNAVELLTVSFVLYCVASGYYIITLEPWKVHSRLTLFVMLCMLVARCVQL